MLTDEEQIEETLTPPKWVEYGVSFFPVFFVVFVLRSFLAEPFQIPSPSMVPTLAIGDFVLVNKYAYGLRVPVFGTKFVPIGLPERGDIMVFVPPHDDRYFIKRVVGTPGDVIRYERKSLTINGERIEYALLEKQPLLPGVRAYSEKLGDEPHVIYRYPGFVEPRDWGTEWVVPEGHYFMMGDNRGKSDDSRRWEYVPEKNIVGKAVAVWMHKDPGWHWPTFAMNRWL